MRHCGQDVLHGVDGLVHHDLAEGLVLEAVGVPLVVGRPLQPLALALRVQRVRLQAVDQLAVAAAVSAAGTRGDLTEATFIVLQF